MLEVIQKGGITMYPIILLSIISVAIFLERLFMLNKNKYVPKALEAQLILLLKKGSIDEAKAIVMNNDSSLARVTNVIIDNMNLPLSRLLEMAEEAGRLEVAKLDRFQQSLLTIVAIAPLLGLLGTVFGMIGIFDVIALQGTGNAQELSVGIAEALVTTAAGLVVAIPTQFFYHIVHARADVCIRSLEEAVSRIVNTVIQEETK